MEIAVEGPGRMGGILAVALWGGRSFPRVGNSVDKGSEAA
jgi:hypothetical protein